MIKNIIFDYGGVISSPGNFKKLEKRYCKLLKISSKKFIPVFHKNWHLWRVDKINEKQLWNNISKEVIFNYNFKQVKKVMRDSHKLKKNTLLLVKKLKNNYKIYILTNHAREWFNYEIKKRNLNKLFDGMFTSYEAKNSKPEKQIYLKFLKKFNCKAKECLFIDDLSKNIEAAKKLGFKGIVFTNLKQLKKDLKKLGIKCQQ